MQPLASRSTKRPKLPLVSTDFDGDVAFTCFQILCLIHLVFQSYYKFLEGNFKARPRLLNSVIALKKNYTTAMWNWKEAAATDRVSPPAAQQDTG